MYVHVVKALAALGKCQGSSEPSQVAYVISLKITLCTWYLSKHAHDNECNISSGSIQSAKIKLGTETHHILDKDKEALFNVPGYSNPHQELAMLKEIYSSMLKAIFIILIRWH